MMVAGRSALGIPGYFFFRKGWSVFLSRFNWTRNLADPITIAILPNYGCTHLGM